MDKEANQLRRSLWSSLIHFFVDLVCFEPPTPANPYLLSLAETVNNNLLNNLTEKFGGTLQVVCNLGTDLVSGICGGAGDLVRRRSAFGSNTYPEVPQKNFSQIMLDDVLMDSICVISTIFFTLVFLTFPYEKPVGITHLLVFLAKGVAPLIVVMGSYALEAKKMYDLRKDLIKFLEARTTMQVLVKRNGLFQLVPISEIVVGDLVFLTVGNQVPGEGLFLVGNIIQVDESRLLWQSYSVVDPDQNPFLISGTLVVYGCGVMIVTSVGMNTRLGNLIRLINRQPDGLPRSQFRLIKIIEFTKFLVGMFMFLAGMFMLVILS